MLEPTPRSASYYFSIHSEGLGLRPDGSKLAETAPVYTLTGRMARDEEASHDVDCSSASRKRERYIR